MLLSLRIKNFALIKDAELELGSGLNILTGETGAGKSILIDAVGLLVGGRASSEFVRFGAEKAVLQGLFSLKPNSPVKDILKSYGVDGADNCIIVSREISRNGRNVCRVDGTIVPASLLKEIGEELVDIHGQHEHQSLIHPSRHLDLLDSFGGKDLLALREEFRGVYTEMTKVKDELENLSGDSRERARKRDLLSYQINEIDGARLKAGEVEELISRRDILAHSERLLKAADKSYQILVGEGSLEGSVVEHLGEIVKDLSSCAAIDSRLEKIYPEIEQALYILQDAGRELSSYAETVEYDPRELEQIEQRLDVIRTLKGKYGDTVEDILKYREELAGELAAMEQAESRAQELEVKLAELRKELDEIGSKLSSMRKSVAANLESAIVAELEGLMMSGTKFKVDLQKTADYTPRGVDAAEFLISPNPGEPLKPLARIASGGEISRIMLALKTALAACDSIPTLIFDEIDSGVGGRAAGLVAERLSRVAAAHQVLCVTHLPQIASFADSHFYLYKKVVGERTETLVCPLSKAEREKELVRMLGGSESANETRDHARALISRAEQAKSGEN